MAAYLEAKRRAEEAMERPAGDHAVAVEAFNRLAERLRQVHRHLEHTDGK